MPRSPRVCTLIVVCLLAPIAAFGQSADRNGRISGSVTGSFGDGGPASTIGLTAGYPLTPTIRVELDGSYVSAGRTYGISTSAGSSAAHPTEYALRSSAFRSRCAGRRCPWGETWCPSSHGALAGSARTCSQARAWRTYDERSASNRSSPGDGR
jgi:hypothetical protein